MANKLRKVLKKENLLYIFDDIILDVEAQTLDDLLEYTQNDLVEKLRNINDDKTNNHKIKTSHRYKFAKTVNKIAVSEDKRKLRSGELSLAFIGKNEQEAINSIQYGQQFAQQNVSNMKTLLNNLDKNNKNIKQNLQTICNLLKQKIDIKYKQMIKMIDDIDKMYSSQLNQQNQTAEQCAKSVSKFYNTYQSFFINENTSQLDRKDKLIASQKGVNTEIDKMQKLIDLTYNIDIVFNENIINRFFEQYLNLTNVHIDILPTIAKPEFVQSLITWKVPSVSSEAVKFTSNDNKLFIEYEILYRSIKKDKKEDETEEKKDNNNEEKKTEKDDNKKEEINNDPDEDKIYEWNEMSNLNVREYNINKYINFPYEVKINYTINHLLKSFNSCSALFEYFVAWSPQHIGDGITLSDNNTKAFCTGGGDRNIRGTNPIEKGMIVKLNYTYYCKGGVDWEIIGVVSSEFNGNWKTVTTPAQDKTLMKFTYGAELNPSKNQYYGALKDLGWTLGPITSTTNAKEEIITMIIDYKTYDTCCLSFYKDGNLKGPQNQKYSMKLPKLENNHVWYPIACLDYQNNWCKIECVGQ